MTDQYMPFFVGDYLRDTMHLSNSQHGQYLKLLCHAWCKGPFDLRKAQAVGGRNINIVLGEFFTQNSDGLWFHIKLEKIKEKNDLIRKKRSEAANKRWCKSNASAYPDAYPSAMQPEPEPEPDKDIKDKEKNKKKVSKKRFDPLKMDLPNWLPKEAWDAWVDHRGAMKPNQRLSTETRCQASIKSLQKIRTNGGDIVEAITNSIAGGYQGIFPPNKNRNEPRGAKAAMTRMGY